MAAWDRFGWFTALREDEKLTRSAYAVGVTIWGHADARGEAWPAVPAIARAAKCSVSTVQRSLRLLEKNGWLKVDFRMTPAGDYDSSLYILSVPVWGGSTVLPGVVSPCYQGGVTTTPGGVNVLPGVVSTCDQGGSRLTGEQSNEQSSKNSPLTLTPASLALSPPASANGHAKLAAPDQSDGTLFPVAVAAKPKRPEPGSDDDPDFTAFWRAYPRKKSKGQARAAWRAAMKRKADPMVIIKAATAYAGDPGRDDRYTAYPATWLNGERYADAAAAEEESWY